METGAGKDLWSVQNIGIISTKFLDLRLKSMKFLDNRAMDVQKE